MRKKRTILISDKKGAGLFVEHFDNRIMIAEKRVKEPLVNKLANIIIKNPKLVAQHQNAKEMKELNYEWILLFADNPKMLNVLRRHKASGLEKDLKGITCPLYMATEVKNK